MKNDNFKLYGLVSCNGGRLADSNAFEASVCGVPGGGCWPSSLGQYASHTGSLPGVILVGIVEDDGQP